MTGPSRETCRVCWVPSSVGFTVPDHIWEAAVPIALRDCVLCLKCFTRLADERLISWDLDIQFWPVSLATLQGGNSG